MAVRRRSTSFSASSSCPLRTFSGRLQRGVTCNNEFNSSRVRAVLQNTVYSAVSMTVGLMDLP